MNVMRWLTIIHANFYNSIHHALIAVKLSQERQMLMGDWLILVVCLAFIAAL
jgi:hypothetical protein